MHVPQTSRDIEMQMEKSNFDFVPFTLFTDQQYNAVRDSSDLTDGVQRK